MMMIQAKQKRKIQKQIKKVKSRCMKTIQAKQKTKIQKQNQNILITLYDDGTAQAEKKDSKTKSGNSNHVV